MDQVLLIQEEPRMSSILVEIPIPTGVQRVQCIDVNQLRSTTNQKVIIKSISLVSPKVLTHGILSGTQNAPLSELKKMSFTVYSNGWERAQYIPVLNLNNTADGDATTATTIPYKNTAPRFDNWQNVAWDKCYIQFANGQPSAANSVLILEVQYVRIDPNGLPIDIASN